MSTLSLGSGKKVRDFDNDVSPGEGEVRCGGPSLEDGQESSPSDTVA